MCEGIFNENIKYCFGSHYCLIPLNRCRSTPENDFFEGSVVAAKIGGLKYDSGKSEYRFICLNPIQNGSNLEVPLDGVVVKSYNALKSEMLGLVERH